jgi:hypothetical protein
VPNAIRIILCAAVLAVSALEARPAGAQACDYHAAPDAVYGVGQGTAGDPFTVREFLELAEPTLQGSVLCLLPGGSGERVFRGPDHVLVPPVGLSGTEATPITVRALDDGAVMFDGRDIDGDEVPDRIPVELLDNAWWVLEGFDACCGDRNTLRVGTGNLGIWNQGSHHTVVRRVVAWDANPAANLGNTQVVSIDGSEALLFEDVAAFGTARKTIQVFKSKDVRLRRVWARWEGSGATSGPNNTFSSSYRSCGVIGENLIGTWTAESQGGVELLSDPTSIFGIGPHQPGPGNPSSCAPYSADLAVYGSLAYVEDVPTLIPPDPPPNDQLAPFDGALYQDSNHIFLADLVSYVEAGAGGVDEPRPLLLDGCVSGGTACTGAAQGLKATNLTLVGTRSASISADWIVNGRLDAATEADLQNPSDDIFDGTGSSGARICHPYADGVLDWREGLWPWPMNDRIQAATLQARGSATDVQGTIEAIFLGGGPVPDECSRACDDDADNDGDGFSDYPADPGCTSPGDVSERVECDDGFDSDGDGLTDYPDDPGCASEDDVSERSSLLPCDDGVDNDDDGRSDFDPDTFADPAWGSGDPGCRSPEWAEEAPACQDGESNDADSFVDFDGGESVHGACTGTPGGCPLGVSDTNGDGVADPDPQCVGKPWKRVERQLSKGCGLGWEVALLLAPLLWLAARARQRRLRASAVCMVLALPIGALPARAGDLVPDGPELQVNTYTALAQKDQRVAKVDGGGFVVIWESDGQDGDDFGIYAQRYDEDLAPLGTEFRVNTTTVGKQASPDAAAVPGGFLASWFGDQGASFYDVIARRYASDGTPLTGEFQVNTYLPDMQRHPSIAVAPDGSFTITWQSRGQDGPNRPGIFGQRFDTDGAPLGGEFQVNTYTAGHQWFHASTMDPSGRLVVVWGSENQDGDSFGIFGQRYDASGAPLGGEFQVNSTSAGLQDFPDVAAHEDGGFLVVWHSDHEADGFGIFGQLYDANGAPMGGEFQVNTDISGDQFQPTAAFEPAAGYLVIWENGYADGSGSDVSGQRYDELGTPIGGEFRVNSPGDQFRHLAKSTANGAGGFLTVWQSDQDGSSDGVYARNYTPAITECCDGIDNDGDGRADFPADPDCSDSLDPFESASGVECSDGVDNDGDGRIDFPDDPGCPSASAVSERTPFLLCDNALDDDGDGRTDFDPATLADPTQGSGDPVCQSPTFTAEGRECQDGYDNDGDGRIDFDGGVSIWGPCVAGVCPPGVSDVDSDGVADKDTRCSKPWVIKEHLPRGIGCGLGWELGLLVPFLALRRSTKRSR